MTELVGPTWLVLLPVAGAVVALAPGRRGSSPVAVVVALATWAAGLAVALPALGAEQPVLHVYGTVPTGLIPITLALAVDGLTAVMVLLVTSVAVAVLLYSHGYLADDPRRASYSSLVLLFTAAMILVVLADDFFVLLVGWEVMGACSYFLIGHYWERREARSGAVKAFLMTRLGDVGMLFGIFILGIGADSFRLSAINAAALDGTLSPVTVTTGLLLVLCGVIGKSAQFPLHTWLPDAMPGPAPISALIHAATMVAAGVYLVARLFAVLTASDIAQTALAVIAGVTMLLGALFALAQDDLKRVLAWSTVSQLAYMFGALAVGGFTAGVFHLLSHGAFKALLFLCAGVVAQAVGSTSMAVMGGLRHRLRWTFLAATIGLGALVGLPPMVGFFSKDAALGAAYEAAVHHGSPNGWVVLVSALLTVVVTAAYSMRAWLMVFFGPTRGALPGHVHDPPWSMRLPIGLLALVTLVGGSVVVVPDVLDPIGQSSTAQLIHPEFAALSIVLVLATLAFTYGEWWRTERRDPAVTLGRWRPVLARELGVDAAYDRGFTRPTMGLSRAVVAADRDVVEPYVRGSGGSARALGAALRWAQNGNVQVYLTAVVVGAMAIGLWVGVAQ